jgi:hypothetical protein
MVSGGWRVSCTLDEGERDRGAPTRTAPATRLCRTRDPAVTPVDSAPRRPRPTRRPAHRSASADARARAPWMDFCILFWVGFDRGDWLANTECQSRHPRGSAASRALLRTTRLVDQRCERRTQRAGLDSPPSSFPQKMRENPCPERARGRRACGGWREAGELSRRTRRDGWRAQVTGRATLHRHHVFSRGCSAAIVDGFLPLRSTKTNLPPGACARASGLWGVA